MTNQRFCPSCQHPIDQGGQFCPMCGIPLPPPAAGTPTVIIDQDRFHRNPPATSASPQRSLARRTIIQGCLIGIIAMLLVGFIPVCAFSMLIASGMAVEFFEGTTDSSPVSNPDNTPVPNPTPRPNRTPTATPALAVRPSATVETSSSSTGVLMTITDTFDDPQSGWLANGETASGRMTYASGSYIMEVHTPTHMIHSLVHPSALASLKPGGSLTIETTYRFPTSDPSVAGIVFHHQSDREWLIFLFDQDGRYTLAERNGSQTITHIPWTYHRITASTYRVRLHLRGTTATLVINNRPIITVDDLPYTTGRIGLACASGDTGKAVVAYDDLSISSSP
mgnify:CR=1 FL=1